MTAKSSTSSGANGTAPNLLEYDLVVSSGGTAAVLSGVGTLLACELAGVKFRRMGGVSGGSIPVGLKSCGMPAKAMIAMALSSDFSANLEPDKGLMRLVRRMNPIKRPGEPVGSDFGVLLQSYDMAEPIGGCCNVDHCKSRPSTGLFGSEPLAHWFNVLTKGDETWWPAGFWTMATTKNGSQVVISSEGVELFTLDGQRVKVSDRPLSLSSAVRASCTIPGVLAALEYKGMLLFDGALSRDGICPVGVQIRNYGADPRRIIACRVNEDALNPVFGRIHRLCRKLWRVHPDFSWGEETAGVIEFRVATDHIYTLKFNLSSDAKWLAIMIAFESCLGALAMRGILTGPALETTRSIFDTLGFWRDAHPSPAGSPQVLTQRIERCLTDHGLL